VCRQSGSASGLCFFADYSINDSKSTLQIFFNQPATKTLATGQQCVKKVRGQVAKSGARWQNLAKVAHGPVFVYIFHKYKNRELILGKGGAKT
jgi:hypothetical protein